jgi:hypothetical protein
VRDIHKCIIYMPFVCSSLCGFSSLLFSPSRVIWSANAPHANEPLICDQQHPHYKGDIYIYAHTPFFLLENVYETFSQVFWLVLIFLSFTVSLFFGVPWCKSLPAALSVSFHSNAECAPVDVNGLSNRRATQNGQNKATSGRPNGFTRFTHKVLLEKSVSHTKFSVWNLFFFRT